jgi:tetratricopeptide (TPR) repeat protein
MSAAQTLLEKKPPATAEQRRVVWTVAAHSRYETGNFAEAEIGYQEALKLMPPQDPDRAAMTDRLASAVYRQGEQSRDAGKLRDAAKHFLRVAQVAPQSSIRPTAEYDAAAALIGANDWDNALLILENFRRSYPKHELQPEVDKKLAAGYLQTNQPGKAAGEFERIVASATDPTTKREALMQAADLYSKGGEEGRSIAMLTQYVKDFPQPLEPAMEARYRLAQYHQQQRNPQAASEWYAQIVQADRSAGSQRTDRTRYLAAKSSLELAKGAMAAYQRVSLVNPLKENIAQKRQLMQNTLNQYGQAADYQVAEVSTEATYLSGMVYNDFSRAIMKSQRPPGLQGEALEEYELLLEEQAIPFEDKAIEVHEINVRRINDGLYDEWVQKSLTDLKQLLPARYNKEERDGNAVTRVH